MSDETRGKVNELKSWFKEHISGPEGQIDADAVMARIREAATHIDRDVDTDVVVARAKEAFSRAEGAVDAEKLKQWVSDIDSGKLEGWVAEAKQRAAKLREDG
jgi:hypothetical protein